MGQLQTAFQRWRETRRRPARRPQRPSELPLYNITLPFEELQPTSVTSIGPISARQTIPEIIITPNSIETSENSSSTLPSNHSSRRESASDENSVLDDRLTETSFNASTISTSYEIPGAWPPPIPTVNVICPSQTASDNSTLTTSYGSKTEATPDEYSELDDRPTETSFEVSALSTSYEIPGTWPPPIPTVNVICPSPTASDNSTLTTSYGSKTEATPDEYSVLDDRQTETSFNASTISTSYEIPGAWPPPIPTLNVICPSPTASDNSTLTTSYGSKTEATPDEYSVLDDRQTEISFEVSALSTSYEIPGAWPPPIPTVNVICPSPTGSVTSSLTLPISLDSKLDDSKAASDSTFDDRPTETSFDHPTTLSTSYKIPGALPPPIPAINVISASPVTSKKSSYDSSTKTDSKSEASSEKDEVLTEISFLDSTLSTFHDIPTISTDEEVSAQAVLIGSSDGVPDNKPIPLSPDEPQPLMHNLPQTSSDNKKTKNPDIQQKLSLISKEDTRDQACVDNEKKDNESPQSDTGLQNTPEMSSDQITDNFDLNPWKLEYLYKDIQSSSGSGSSTLYDIPTLSGSSSDRQYTDPACSNMDEVSQVVELPMDDKSASKSDNKKNISKTDKEDPIPSVILDVEELNKAINNEALQCPLSVILEAEAAVTPETHKVDDAVPSSRNHPIEIDAIVEVHDAASSSSLSHPIEIEAVDDAVPSSSRSHPIDIEAVEDVVPRSSRSHPIEIEAVDDAVPNFSRSHPIEIEAIVEVHDAVSSSSRNHPIETEAVDDAVPRSSRSHPIDIEAVEDVVPRSSRSHPIEIEAIDDAVPNSSRSHPIEIEAIVEVHDAVSSSSRNHPIETEAVDDVVPRSSRSHPIEIEAVDDAVPSSSRNHPLEIEAVDDAVPSSSRNHPLEIEAVDDAVPSSSRNHPLEIEAVDDAVPSSSRNHPLEIEAIVIEFPSEREEESISPANLSVRFEDFIEHKEKMKEAAKLEPSFKTYIDPELYVEVQRTHDEYCSDLVLGRKYQRSAEKDQYLKGVLDDTNVDTITSTTTEECASSVPADLRSDAGLEFGISSSANAMRKFLAGDEEGALHLNNPWRLTSIYNFFCNCLILFLKAAITGHRGYIHHAEVSLSEFEKMFNPNLYQNIGTCWNSGALSYFQIHLAVCKAECRLYRGLLGLMKPLSFWNKIKAIHYIACANISYLKCKEIFAQNVEFLNNTSLTTSYKHSLDYGSAILNILMALIPRKYKHWFTLLSCIRRGNRLEGMKTLKHCHKKTNNLPGLMSDMIILLYNCNRMQLNTVIDHKRVKKIFNRFDNQGLKSPWVKFLHAKYLTMAGSFRESLEMYTEILKKYPPAVLKQLIHCQLGYLYSLHTEWGLASQLMTPIPDVDDNFELTAYSKVAFRMQLRKFVIATERKQLSLMFNKIIMTDVVPPEDIMLYRVIRKRCYSYFEQNNALVLPGLELIHMLGYYDAIRNNMCYAHTFLEEIEEAVRFIENLGYPRSEHYNDNLALVRYLHGCALRMNNNPHAALVILQTVLETKDLTASHVLPLANYEMALCEIDRRNFDLALQILNRNLRKYYDYEREFVIVAKVQELITMVQEVMPLLGSTAPKKISHPLLQPPPYSQTNDTNENMQ